MITTKHKHGINDTNRFAKLLEKLYPGQVWDDSARRTAERFLSYLEEYTFNADLEDPPFNFTTFPNELAEPGGNVKKVNQLIVCKDMAFSSICQHHLLPYFGEAHVGYLPNELMVGLSKIPRLVEWLARRPTTQEALTAAIASRMKKELRCMGVAVLLKAHHTCMGCRGVRQVNAKMVTSETRGIFLTAGGAKLEWLEMIK